MKNSNTQKDSSVALWALEDTANLKRQWRAVGAQDAFGTLCFGVWDFLGIWRFGP
jgi:hypothetical protein